LYGIVTVFDPATPVSVGWYETPLPKFPGIIAVKPPELVQGNSVVDPLAVNTADAVTT
jgi:hypothetical protein